MLAHNAVSRLVAEDQLIHDWVGASTDHLWQGAAQTCKALDRFPGSQEPNAHYQSHQRIVGGCGTSSEFILTGTRVLYGFALANHTDKSVYEEFSKFPEQARQFGNAMRCRSFTEGTGFELSHIVDNFPWETLKDGTVVDVRSNRTQMAFTMSSADRISRYDRRHQEHLDCLIPHTYY